MIWKLEFGNNLTRKDSEKGRKVKKREKIVKKDENSRVFETFIYFKQYIPLPLNIGNWDLILMNLGTVLWHEYMAFMISKETENLQGCEEIKFAFLIITNQVSNLSKLNQNHLSGFLSQKYVLLYRNIKD